MITSVSVSVSCTSLSKTILQKAKELSKKHGLPFTFEDDESFDYQLVVTDSRLELRSSNPPTGKKDSVPSPIYVDFRSGSNAYRHHRNKTINQPLAKAVGIRSGFRPFIVDATAGLGGDSFVFATLGCRVLLCERSPIVFALLEDGISRALADNGTIGEASRKMQLVNDQATALFSSLKEQPHTIYFDPMYPHSEKAALNRKEMRILRDIVGDDCDLDTTLYEALNTASNRVVVKRPKGAEYAGELKPNMEIKMKNSRFDIYLTPYL